MNATSLDQVKAALEAAAKRSSPGASSQPVNGEFGDVLNAALKQVSQVQASAAEQQQAFQAGDPAVSLEQTMVAMQKSQIAFQATVTVRNRLVSAYSEIMNMQV